MLRKAFARAIALDVGADNALPTEFVIFRAGVNDTTQGPVLFDDAAAALVMAAYAEHGVDVAIDLQHDSIDDAARAARNDAVDARGWCKLEVRDGELWAVDVTWTPDGARRLLERTQRYISPVAFYDPDADNRVTDIFNLALVSMPATHHAPALVASRSIQLENRMDPKLIQEALDALIAGDAEACATILKSLVVSAAGGEGDASDDAAADAGTDALAQTADAPPAPPAAPEKDDPAAMAAALRSTLKVDGNVAILAEVNAMKAKIEALTLAHDAAELGERLDLVGELVKLGVELPATAWADADKRVPCDTLRTMKLADLRARVAAFRAAPRTAPAVAPRREALDVAALSDSDQTRAGQIADPAARARFVAARLAHGSK